MNEGFQVSLRRNGRAWPIDGREDGGVILSRERDAFPRSVTLEFDARSEATAYRMNRVRQLRGWEPLEFKLMHDVVDGKLSFKGDDANSLPAGAYWIRLRITDLKVTGRRVNLDIDEDESDAQVDVDVQPDPRTVSLTTHLMPSIPRSTASSPLRTACSMAFQSRTGLAHATRDRPARPAF